jgi:hypothetical protein
LERNNYKMRRVEEIKIENGRRRRRRRRRRKKKIIS